MGFFNKRRTDGATFDGQGEERKGLIDVIEYRGLPDDILWKFPYNNISTGAQLVVSPGQEAIFVKGGTICDVFGEGTHTLDAHNIPIIQKLVNLPFGGKTPFTAEVYYVSLTAKRNLTFGTSIYAHDSYYDTLVRVKGYGKYGVRVVDSTTFMRELVSTQHLFDTDSVIENFDAKIGEVAASGIQRYIQETRISVTTQMSALAPTISAYIRQALQDEFSKYGLHVENFNFEALEPDVEGMMKSRQEGKAKGMEEKARLDELEATYQQERQFDVMQTAAGNEGSAGQMMGAGMGLGMGFGVGNAFGNQMNQMAGSMAPQSAPPPPPTAYHVLVDGMQQGPFDMGTLARLAQEGRLTRDTYVWKNGMPQWAKAGECMELQHLFGAIPPPPPPMP